MIEKKPLELVIDILKEYRICPECLGRQFALLGTSLSNTERGTSLLNSLILKYHYIILNLDSSIEDENYEKAYNILKKIATNSNYKPVKDLLDKAGIIYKDYAEEFSCSLCNNLFLKIDDIIHQISESVDEYEFKNFLVGTIVEPHIQDREDEFRARLKISTGEAYKRNINRVIGLTLYNEWKNKGRDVEFDNPEMNIYIKINPKHFSIDIQSNPLCIQGRYHKYERGIPQTFWPHRNCHGKGCKECNFSGKQYPTSVEELLEPFFQKYVQGSPKGTKGRGYKFHGAGREDIDARCLGNGRPYILEIKNPKKRTIPLDIIEKEIKENIGKRVDVIELSIVPRSEIKNLKSSGEGTSKSYSALVKSEKEISKESFNEILKSVVEKIQNKVIFQRTPIRVIHRRADLTREKKIYEIKGEWIDNYHSRFEILAMGGTYIKELISGDSNRTNPSISGIFGIPMICVELDVLGVNKLN
ncbi:MAG: tRNA pseudouridine(54/55) synthase Pus10 [archaeon]|nr:tRNA pseudouridine(54/55) synthase Pus10 [archaeon]